ncbi:hypothetical protein RCL1_007953 [Eukaryota sp. TZLM3-RCL]
MQRRNQTIEDQREAVISYRMGLTLFKSADYTQAISCFSRAISLVPSSSKYFFARGHCWRLQNDLLRAVFDYTMAIRIESDLHSKPAPEMGSYHAYRGIAFRKLGRIEEAILDQTLAIKLDPSLDMAWHNRGLCLAIQDKHEDAILDFEKSISVNPKQFKSHFNCGNSLFILSRYEEAYTKYKSAALMDSSHASVFNNIGLCCLHLNRFAEATTAFSTSIKKLSNSPNSASFLNNRALAYYAVGDYTSALEDLTNAISLNSNDVQLYFNRGNTHRAAKHVDLALSDFQIAEKLCPNDGLIHFAQGLVYRMKKKDDVAVKKFLVALELEPNYVPILHHLGLVYLIQKRFMDASELFEKAINLSPNIREYRLCRAKTAFELCEWKVVIDHVSVALDLSSPTPADLLLRGTAYYRRHLYKESLQDLLLAAEKMEFINKSDSKTRFEIWLGTTSTSSSAGDPSSPSAVSPYFATSTLPCSAVNSHHSKTILFSSNHSLNNDIMEVNVKTVNQEFSRLSDLIFTALARTERALGRLDDAIRHLSVALESNSKNLTVESSEVLFARAQCYFDLGRFPESIDDITTAIALSKNAVLYFWRGKYRTSLHDYEGAAVDFETTLQLVIDGNDDNSLDSSKLGLSLTAESKSLSISEVYQHLALVYAHLGQFEKAERFCSMAIDNRLIQDLPPAVFLVLEHAKMSQCAGKHKQAVKLFSDVISREPGNPRAYFRRGFSYKKLELFEKAALDFETARRLDPNDPVFVVDYHNVGSVEYFEW